MPINLFFTWKKSIRKHYLQRTAGLLLVIQVCALSGFSQLNRDGKAPEEVETAFKEKYFPFDAVTWEWDKKVLHYLAHFYQGTKEFTAHFDTFGKWIKTVRTIREEELPAEIKFNLGNSAFKHWEVRKIEEEVNRKDVMLFKMQLSDPGNGSIRRRTVFLTFYPDGKLLSMERKI